MFIEDSLHLPFLLYLPTFLQKEDFDKSQFMAGCL